MGFSSGTSSSQNCRTISCNHLVSMPLAVKMGCGDRTAGVRSASGKPFRPAGSAPPDSASTWQRSL